MPTENTASLNHGTITVTDAATRIVTGRSGRGGGLLIQNLSAGDIFIGGSGVTIANGIKVPAGGSISFDSYSGDLYGRVAAGTADVRFMETY